jgi:hypothetical protein
MYRCSKLGRRLRRTLFAFDQSFQTTVGFSVDSF